MSEHRIVASGRDNAWSANLPAARAEVEKEFAERMASAGFWKRLLLRRRIEKEIRRRMEENAPRRALY